jgi:hypothetical protein
MNRTDAEEYTQALGQVTSGAWRQVALGQRLGVPEALGLSTTEWVECHLGGYVRLGITERRQAVAELTAPVEEGGMGLSQRQAGAVLGVDQKTVSNDSRAEERSSVVATATSPDPDRSEEDSSEDRADWVALQWLSNMRKYCDLLAAGLESDFIPRAIRAGGKLPSLRKAKKIVALLEKLEAKL